MGVLKRFCCCMTLRTGAIFIGISGILFTLPLLIIVLATNLKLSSLFVPDSSGLLTKISFAFEMIILIAISILLIVGASRGKRWYLVPWLVVSVVIVAGLFIADIYSIAVMFQNGNNTGGGILIVYAILVTGLSIYYWLVVFSLFQELGENERRGYELPPGRGY